MPALLNKKSNGDSATVRLNEVDFVLPPPTPVTTSGNVPAGVEALVVTVRVDEQAGPQEGTEKDPLAPLGKPATENATGSPLPDKREAAIWF